MPRVDIRAMSFRKVYECLIAKAERKGRTREEVDAVTSWLTGYSPAGLASFMVSDLCYGDFLEKAPHWNEKAKEIKGSICGIKVETIEDPFLWKVRCLDKLVDDLAKGKPLEKVLRSSL